MRIIIVIIRSGIKLTRSFGTHRPTAPDSSDRLSCNAVASNSRIERSACLAREQYKRSAAPRSCRHSRARSPGMRSRSPGSCWSCRLGPRIVSPCVHCKWLLCRHAPCPSRSPNPRRRPQRSHPRRPRRLVRCPQPPLRLLQPHLLPRVECAQRRHRRPRRPRRSALRRSSSVQARRHRLPSRSSSARRHRLPPHRNRRSLLRRLQHRPHPRRRLRPRRRPRRPWLPNLQQTSRQRRPPPPSRHPRLRPPHARQRA